MFAFIVCPIRGLPEYIKTKVLTNYFCLMKSFFFKKKKKRSGASLPTSFSAWFLKKNFTHVIFY